jgi:hypothetical protein
MRRYSVVLALVVLAAAACRSDDEKQTSEGDSERPGQLAVTDCRLHDTMPAAVVAMAVNTAWAGAPGLADTAKLRNGPTAEIMLNAAYDTAAAYDTGAVVARLRALEPIGYPRMNLAPSGTTYIWAQMCGSQVHIYFVSDDATQGTRAPAWVSHGHSYPAGVHVSLRDTTISSSVDSLLAAGLVDSLEADTTRADSTSGDVKFITMEVTKVCARCPKGGWCTGV